MNLRIGLAACSLVAFTPVAMAQTMKPPGDGASSGQQAPSSIQNGRSESLSGKLDKSGGVITPTGDVDPAIQAPAPGAPTEFDACHSPVGDRRPERQVEAQR